MTSYAIRKQIENIEDYVLIGFDSPIWIHNHWPFVETVMQQLFALSDSFSVPFNGLDLADRLWSS